MGSGPSYPFVPKSNRHLEAGQYWAVPLDDGRFACGRVMAATSAVSPRMSFIAGLMDWVGPVPPTAESIAGHDVLEQGSAHIKTITQTGGEVLGCRSLDEDRLAADPDPGSTWATRSSLAWPNTTSGARSSRG